jgi:predicted secreted Zn-dependent protease
MVAAVFRRSSGLGRNLNGGTQRIGLVRRIALCAIAAVLALPVSAAVTSDTQYRTYSIGGTTEKTIVRYMRQHPYKGDHGDAYANLKHRYRLKLATSDNHGQCKVDRLDLDIDFMMTLPRSANPERLTGSARSAFNAFASFAKRHEEHHRASFIECGKAFAAKARQMEAGQCAALSSDIRALLRKAERDCEAKQRAFDRQQSRAVQGLTLFRRGG